MVALGLYATRRRPTLDMVPHATGGVQIPHIIAQFALIFSHLVRGLGWCKGWTGLKP